MNGLLYNRTSYTLMTSTLTIQKLVNFALENGYEAVGIADRNVLHGFMELYHLCKNNALKPLYGLEIDINIENDSYPIVLYAKNIKGFQKIIEISTAINIERKVFSFEEVINNDDIFVVEIDKSSYLEHLVNFNNDSRLNDLLEGRSSFSNYYIGLSSETNDNNYYQQLSTKIYTSAKKHNINCIATPLGLYAYKDDFNAFKALNAIKAQTTVYDQRLKVQENAHLLSSDEYANSFNLEILTNTSEFIGSCNVDLSQLEKATLPKFNCPEGADSFTYLKSLCVAGLKKRFDSDEVPGSYSHRLNYELNIIREMGFSDYFLIVWDVIKFAKNHGIYVGVGRGSVTGCLAAYCLGITHIDPLKYNLIFERFLNPERISMPDIDIDFPDDKRALVISYVKDKYHDDHIAHILTFGTFGVKQLIRDLGKALNVNSTIINIINSTVSNRPDTTLKSSYTQNVRFKKAIDSSDETRYLFKLAMVLEDLPRHYSTHAAGVVFSDRPLIINCPYMSLNDNLNTTQYTMQYLEELGLIKMDFLSLRNLSIISNIVDIVNDSKSFDILKIPLDDKKTYDLIAQAKTTGVFQLESDGMKNLLRKMKPNCFEDVIAAIALFRPGPMENIPAYLEARKNPSKANYFVAELEPVLKSTYGVMVYQEQVMQVAQIVAGFSLGKADILRKAVSKKIPDELAKLKTDFMNGALQKGYNEAIATKIYDTIEKFGDYGFNKSHSVAYALVAYQLAYLKANYPQAFYLSLLNSVINDETKTNEYLVECRNVGIKILPPDINYSSINYQQESNDIRFPLTCIKGVGNVATKKIVDERIKNGLYKDYFDFVARNYKSINRNIITTLINAGCLDSMNLTRNTMIKGLDETFRYSDLVSVDNNGQISIDFNLVSKPLLTNYDDSPSENSQNEIDLIGFYLKGHPVEKYRKDYPNSLTSSIAKKRRGTVEAIVRIHRIKEHRTKTGELMCFIDGFDEIGDISLVLMPNVYRQYADIIKKYSIILVNGSVDERESIKVKTLKVLEV